MNSFVTFWIIALDNYYNIALHFFFFWVNLLMEFEDILWLFMFFLTEVSTTHIYNYQQCSWVMVSLWLCRLQLSFSSS